ncbi:MAG: DedA family protein [Verrucomicrobia bacterium]|nr:MAG: DedA family protein [Verrucomicrobiota bacterium]
MIRKLYKWVLHWADTPYALPALFLLAFTESSFFPIPPDVLLMALCMGAPKRSFRYVFWCSLASVLGGILGYYIGYGFYDTIGVRIIDTLGYQHHFETVGTYYGDNAFLAIVTAAFTPIPYKVFTIAAGVFHENVSLATLVLASSIGRTARFALVGGAIYFFGPPVKAILDKYLEWLTIAFALLLIGGFVLIKVLH